MNYWIPQIVRIVRDPEFEWPTIACKRRSVWQGLKGYLLSLTAPGPEIYRVNPLAVGGYRSEIVAGETAPRLLIVSSLAAWQICILAVVGASGLRCLL